MHYKITIIIYIIFKDLSILVDRKSSADPTLAARTSQTAIECNAICIHFGRNTQNKKLLSYLKTQYDGGRAIRKEARL